MTVFSSNALITTIIPTYQRPKLLQRAIRSVLNQTYPQVEVCVYDNASGDETASVVTELAKKDPRVKYHCHSQNIGSLKNFEYGLKQVDTEWFSILSDDDLILPEFYATAIREFEQYPEAGFVVQGVLNANTWGDIFPDGVMSHCKAGLYKPFDGLLAMLLDSTPTWTGIVFRKSVLNEVGLLDEEVGVASDMDFVLRAASKCPFVHHLQPGAIFIPAPLARTTSFRGSVDALWPGWLKMIRNLSEDGRVPTSVRRQIKSILMDKLKRRLLQIGLAAVLRGDFPESYKAARILRGDCHVKAKGIFLHATARVCDDVALVRYVFLWVNHIRSRLLRFQQLRVGNGYSQYKSMLNCK